MTAGMDAAATKSELASSIELLQSAIRLAESRQPALVEAVADAKKVLEKAEACSAGGVACAATEHQQQAVAALKSARDLVGEASTATGIGQALDEWKECRSTIDRCDKLLVDLRKTGFGFVTAIVGAATFLFTENSTRGVATDDAKAALLCMLVLLIVVLYWIDLAHQTWLGVAVERAKKLESHPLGFELTGNIGKEFAAAQAILLGLGIYFFLLIATCAIFWNAIHAQTGWYRTIIEGAFFVGSAAMLAGLLTSKKLWPSLTALGTFVALILPIITSSGPDR